MHPNLIPLPEALLRNLGRASHLDDLAQLLAAHGLAPDKLRQHQNGKPYSLSLTPHGIDLSLQCVNPDATQDQWQWGLQSLTLHTAASNPANQWTHPWPQGLEPEQACAGDVVRLLAINPEEALHTPTLACFAVEGMNGQTWAVAATFDQSSLKLQTLSLLRSGEWIARIEGKLAGLTAT